MPSSSTILAIDMRTLRLDRYTTAAANETRSFIEECLGEQLMQGDLLDALKDGVALCKLVNKVVPDILRFKTKATMPFVQMENISLFLEACRSPPLCLQSHDIFLTVDLYERKDPAQVLQCLAAFSRAAHKIDPVRFPNPIGARSNMSSQSTGTTKSHSTHDDRRRIVSNSSCSSPKNQNTKTMLTSTLTGNSSNGTNSLGKSTGTQLFPGVSSWSNKTDQEFTSPAWNIAQYGYLGGASQANMGVLFGGRRQITSAGPFVPKITEKNIKRKEKEAQAEELRLEAEEFKKQRQKFNAAKDEEARINEEKKWAEEAEILRERKRSRVDEENRKWKEEEERWRLEEEKRRQEELKAEARFQEENSRLITAKNSRWKGQLTNYHHAKTRDINSSSSSEKNRIKELEYELEQARAREREYERLRKTMLLEKKFQTEEENDFAVRNSGISKSRASSRSRLPSSSKREKDETWGEQRHESLGSKWSFTDSSSDPSSEFSSSATTESLLSLVPSRPLPQPKPLSQIPKQRSGPRPLPDPTEYAVLSPNKYINFIDSFSNSESQLKSDSELPNTPFLDNSSVCIFDDTENSPWQQKKTTSKGGGLNVNSLLEREMEMERKRQKEWEEGQQILKENVANNNKEIGGAGMRPWGRLGVKQWTEIVGCESQNNASQTIESGRRQIVGPRPLPYGR